MSPVLLVRLNWGFCLTNMPRGIYTRTVEQIKHQIESRHRTGWWKNLGETRKKWHVSRMGKHQSIVTKHKHSEAMKGDKNPMKRLDTID